jgi:hypothetical protein
MLSEASYHNMTVGRIPSVEGGIQPTIVDAKGDLIAAVAADSLNRLAVGSNDQVLVADSAASTGLAWKSYGAQFVAGKNKIINGDFSVWQRGTTFNSATNGTFLADRWTVGRDGTNTVNLTQQTFTPGTAPVAGYEGQFFARASIASTGTLSFLQFAQAIEDVRTFAGQTITISFWAKGSSAASGIVYFEQNFGSGGSAIVETGYPSFSLTTSWQRFSVTIAVPSVSGKTIGTSSFLKIFIRGGLTANSSTFDIWGVQVEAGSVATPFTTATGTIQGELAACQRYYYRATPSTAASGFGGLSETGIGVNSTKVRCQVRLPVTMRAAPTSVDFSTICVFDTATTIAVTAVSLLYETFNHGSIELTVASGVTQFRPYTINGNASTSAYLGFNAEL